MPLNHRRTVMRQAAPRLCELRVAALVGLAWSYSHAYPTRRSCRGEELPSQCINLTAGDNDFQRPQIAPPTGARWRVENGGDPPEAVEMLLELLADELAGRWDELDAVLGTTCEASFRRLGRPSPLDPSR